MIVRGTNIQTLNKSELTRRLYIERGGVKIELVTTGRGIAMNISNGKVVRNGDELLLLPLTAHVERFEYEVMRHE